MANTCPECGAPVDPGQSCRDHFESLLAMEWQIPGGPGKLSHFFAVSAYALQHPLAMNYTREALNGLRAAVADAINGGASTEDLRLRAAAAADELGRVTRREGDAAAGWQISEWPLTIADVLPTMHEQASYARGVSLWARSVLDALDSHDSLQVRIREARPEDAEALSAIARESKAHWGYPPEVLQKWQRELTVTAGQLASHTAHVAEVDGAPVGFCLLRQDGGHCTLEHLWVTPRWMGQRIGAALLRRALQAAQDNQAPCVRVVSDPHAAGFYEHQGGVRVGAVPAPLPGAPERELPLYEIRVAMA